MNSIRKTLFAFTAGAALFAGPAMSAGVGHVEDVDFHFEGPFGTFDQHQLQRGFQVFQEVCSACHGIRYVSFRNLGSETGPGFPDEQVKAIAEYYEVPDEEGEPGDTRPGKPFDKFPVNAGAGAPDLSLMAKARAGFHGPAGTGISQLVNGIGGPEYIYSLLTGYVDEPECAADADMDGYYNIAFAAGGFPDSCKDEDGHHMAPGSWISMAPPLYGDDVEYADGTEASLEQEAEDIAEFLMWTAEPNLVDRKMAGARNIGFLILLSVLLYLTNKKLWAPVKRKDH